MARATTASYILELELNTNPHERKVLNKKLEVGRQIYNTCLGQALKCLHRVLADKEYRQLLEEPSSQTRNKRLREIERSYGYSEYQLHEFVKDSQKHFLDEKTVTKSGKSKQSFHIGSLEAQALATRAFRAVEKVHYHQAEKVYFKHFGDDFSVENKSNTTGLRWKDDFVLWGNLKLSVRIKKNDTYAQKALLDRTKYVRVLKKEIRGRERFYVQLIQEGTPPTKDRKKGNGTVGLDIGPATVAIVSDSHVELRELADGIATDTKALWRTERAMDRSKRATNPDNFDNNGVTKHGCKWVYSNRYKKRKAKRKDLHRKIAAKRKQSHEILANEVLTHGTDVKVETMRFQGLQKRAKKTTRNRKNGKFNKKKRFGKSIGNHAPAMFLSILERKLSYIGKTLKKVDTYQLKASQFNHVTGEYQKKLLSDRWNDIAGHRIQRDLYSAFLIRNANDDLQTINVNECNQHWEIFVKLHNDEINQIKTNASKNLKWYVA